MFLELMFSVFHPLRSFFSKSNLDVPALFKKKIYSLRSRFVLRGIPLDMSSATPLVFDMILPLLLQNRMDFRNSFCKMQLTF